MPFCPACGSEVEHTDQFCRNCGETLPEPATPDTPDRIQKEPPTAESDELFRSQDESLTTGTQESADTATADEDSGVLFFSIEYPARSGIKPPVIGGLLLLLFPLVLPIFLALGYYVRVAAAAANGDEQPPGFDALGEMIIEGIILFLLFIPIFIAYGILVFLTAEIHFALSIPVIIAGIYLFPAIFLNYAVERDWKAGYDVSTIVDLVTTKPYFVGFLIYALLINGLGSIVVGIALLLSLLTIVGWILLWPMIYFYWYAIDAALWGRVYRQIHT